MPNGKAPARCRRRQPRPRRPAQPMARRSQALGPGTAAGTVRSPDRADRAFWLNELLSLPKNIQVLFRLFGEPKLVAAFGGGDGMLFPRGRLPIVPSVFVPVHIGSGLGVPVSLNPTA